jgi:ABC-type phosphate transport system, periplasmic component
MVAAHTAVRYNKAVPKENTEKQENIGRKCIPAFIGGKRVMKKITRRSFITVCGAAAAAMALTACGGAASSTVASSAAESTSSSAAAETAAGTLSGNVATGGSTSMKNVIAALTEGFAEVEPGVTVSYEPTGSGAGFTGATDKTLDIGLVLPRPEGRREEGRVRHCRGAGRDRLHCPQGQQGSKPNR